MRKTLAVATLTVVTLGTPLAVEAVFTGAQSHAVAISAKGHGNGGESHHSTGKRAHRERAGFKTDTCMEDEPCWSCVDDGNRVCGPNNSEGKPAGCYDDGGVLEYVWPCNPWKPSDGWVHRDGSITFPDGHTTPATPDHQRPDSDDGAPDGSVTFDPDEAVYTIGYRN
jgi:hypothetical protein